MLRVLFLSLAISLASAAAWAQQTAPASPCLRPDSIAVRGNSRVSRASLISDAGIAPGDTLNFRVVQRSLRNPYATGQFADGQVGYDPHSQTNQSVLSLPVTERPILRGVAVTGPK